MNRVVYFAIPPSLRTPTILSRVQQLSRLHCRLSSAHALEGERVKVCPPFTRGQVFETCNFFLLRFFYSRFPFFFLLLHLLLFFFIRLFYTFTRFSLSFGITWFLFKTIYISKYIQNITKNYNTVRKLLHTIPILKNKIKILYLRINIFINAKKKKNVSINHKEEIVVPMKIDRAASSAIIVRKNYSRKWLVATYRISHEKGYTRVCIFPTQKHHINTAR